MPVFKIAVVSALTIAAGLAVSARQEALEPPVIPRPVHAASCEGLFTLTAATPIATDDASQDVGRLLAEMLDQSTGYRLKVRKTGSDPAHAISVRLDPALSRLGREGYTLSVTPDRVAIRAAAPAGAFYGAESLRQLLPPQIYAKTPQSGVTWQAPCVSIEDHPRFQWRGAMMDTGRHFMPKAFVEEFIDLLAMHKLNTFHWHLTDDQGWRIEIKKYPKLTQVGSRRKETRVGHEGPNAGFDGVPYGGFYTQKDIREIVEYARRRFVTIVPEIEMPGHAQAAIAAYPELGNTGAPVDVGTVWGVYKNIFNASDSTIRFLQNVLDEVLTLFPGPFIHIGGDEAVKDQWKASPAAQARIKALGLKDEEDLQAYFVHQMDLYLTKKGRRLVGWDEILNDTLSPSSVVMAWHGANRAVAAAEAGHDVVMTPTSYVYFDYYQSRDTAHEPLAIGGFLPLDRVYSFEPIPEGLPDANATHILGAQGNLWTEYIPTPKQFEYMAFPRLLALSEVVWSPKAGRNFPEFLDRLKVEELRLRAAGVNFRPEP